MILLLLIAAQAPPKLGCDSTKADQGKCKSAETCNCDPVRGARTQAQTPKEDGRTKTLTYFDPAAYVVDAEAPPRQPARDNVANPITVQVAEEFWTPPGSRKFYESGGMTLQKIKKACAQEMHQVFDVQVVSTRNEVVLGMEATVVHFKILYGYSYYIRGPGTAFNYVTVYSSLPKRFCHLAGGVSYPLDTSPHQGNTPCGGHDEPWERSAKHDMLEFINKKREAESCPACATPYEGRMKSSYYAQWELQVGGTGASPPGEPAGPSPDLTINWAEVADLVADAVPAVLAATPPGAVIQELASNSDLFTLSPGGGGGGSSPDQDALTIVAECGTRMELDPSGQPDPASTTMNATESRTVTAAASAAHPSDGSSSEHWRQNALRSGASVLQAGRQTMPPGTRDKSGRTLNGEMLTWETRVHNGPFQKAARIVDAVGVAVSIKSSGRSWGKGTFTLSSVPCLEAIHPCECSHYPPHIYKFPKLTPPMIPPYRIRLEDFTLLLDIPCVVIPAAGVVEVEMKEGFVLTHGPGREMTAIGGGPYHAVIPLRIIPGDRIKPRPRIRLPDGGASPPIDFDRPRRRTGLLIVEDVDRPDPQYRLRTRDGADVTGYHIDVTVHDGDFAYHVGRFGPLEEAGSSALQSTPPDQLDLVDETGTSTPLTGIQLGSAMPTIQLPATVAAGKPATASVQSDFAQAARASGLPASLLRTKIWQRTAGGDRLLATTTSPVESLSVSPAPGEKEIRLVARYVPEPGALEEALSALRDAADRAKPALPPETHDAVDAAVRAREAALRERLKR